ncbi:hypothetical protein T01_6838 [Trichinella spiralis]|uniref:Uncharacterized protein n=1 Tax=Trichinella spiralis TaxID=6334 RepID=A0A0V1BX25_TRISP|nr:hypothetical protein T01_6838 [Trichinella spiralis]
MRKRGKKASHPAQFKDAADEDRGWLLVTDPHDRTRRYPISHCTACRLVIDPRARRSLMIRGSSKSKPPRNEPLIYRRAASRGTVSKTIEDQISVDPPRCPPPRKPSIYWNEKTERDLLSFYQSESADRHGDEWYVWRCVQRMSTRRQGRVSEKEQAQCDGGRTGADPEADRPAPPGSVPLQFNKIQ